MNKKILVIPMLGIIIPTISACGKKGGTIDDPTKANLHVITLDKGIGTKWLENAAAIFNEMYAESEDFQQGRKVQIPRFY